MSEQGTGMASAAAGAGMNIGDVIASTPLEPFRSRDPYDSFDFASEAAPGAGSNFAGAGAVAGMPWTRNLVRQFQQPQAHQSRAKVATDPFGRLFESPIGQAALSIIGNESATLAQIGTFAAESLAASLMLMPGRQARRSHGFWTDETVRTLVVAAPPGLNVAPTVLVLDPAADREPQRVTSEVGVVPELIGDLHTALDSPQNAQGVGRMLFDSGPEGVLAAMWIARPEVIIARLPAMVSLACPSPALEVRCGTERSSVGMFCRDADGVAGATACLHGTGWIGTAVTLGGMPTVVKHANAVQDIVFLPLPDGYVVPNFANGVAGVRRDRAPAQNDPAAFDGCTSGSRQTVVSSHDAGLLRNRPTLQLKVQTPADVNRGDSGSALIDEHDRVMAFAFERTDFEARIQFADWIWAANALDSLGLTTL